MKLAQKPLGSLEQDIMRIVWAKRQVSVRQVYDELAQQRPLAYTTIMTTMDRLTKKGILERVKAGRAYEYHTVTTEQEFNAQVSRSIIDLLLHRYGDLAITQFIDAVDEVDPAKLDSLKRQQR